MEKYGRSVGSSTEIGKPAGPAISTLHVAIRQWAEEHGAKPARVKGGLGMLRLELAGQRGGEPLEHISWEEWFERFHEQNLALLHDEITTRGRLSSLSFLTSGSPATKKSPGITKRSTAKTGSHRTKVSKAKKAA